MSRINRPTVGAQAGLSAQKLAKDPKPEATKKPPAGGGRTPSTRDEFVAGNRAGIKLGASAQVSATPVTNVAQAAGGLGAQVKPALSPDVVPGKPLGMPSLQDMNDAARRNLPGYGKLADLAGAGAQAVKDGTQRLVEGADRMLEGIKTAGAERDIAKQVPTLQDGEKLNVTLGNSGELGPIRASSKGQLEVSREKDDAGNPVYKVTVDLESLSGVGKDLMKSVKGGASLGGGGKVELSYSNPKDAQRAVELMQRTATVAEPNSPVQMGGMRSAATGPELEELAKTVRENVSAVELRGTGASELAASYGVGPINGEVGGKAQVSPAVRLEFTKDEAGKPAIDVVFKNTSQLEGGAGLGLQVKGKTGRKLEDGTPEEAGGGLKPGANAKVTGKLEEEYRVRLPSDTSKEQLLQDPKGTLLAMPEKVRDSVKVKLTVSSESQVGAFGNGKGQTREVSVSGNLKDMVKDGSLIRLKAGDYEGGLRSGGDKLKVQEKSVDWKQTGIAFAPGINIGVAGGGFEFESTRRTPEQPPQQRELNGAQKAEELRKAREAEALRAAS